MDEWNLALLNHNCNSSPQNAARILLIGQLKLALARAERGLKVGLGSVLRAAFLMSEMEGEK